LLGPGDFLDENAGRWERAPLVEVRDDDRGPRAAGDTTTRRCAVSSAVSSSTTEQQQPPPMWVAETMVRWDRRREEVYALLTGRSAPEPGERERELSEAFLERDAADDAANAARTDAEHDAAEARWERAQARIDALREGGDVSTGDGGDVSAGPAPAWRQRFAESGLLRDDSDEAAREALREAWS